MKERHLGTDNENEENVDFDDKNICMRKRTQCKGVFDVLTFGKDDEVGVHDDFYDSDDGGLDDVDDDINEKGHSMQRDVPSLCDVNHEGSYCLTSTFIITTLTAGQCFSGCDAIFWSKGDLSSKYVFNQTIVVMENI